MTEKDGLSKCPLEWPNSKRAYLTIDFECDYGTAITKNYYHAVNQTDQLIKMLEDHQVPLSCFLQTEILDKCPESVVPLREADVPVEFHAHSHTHPARAAADVEYEVEESARRVRDAFDPDIIGFRFPDGASQPQDYAVLADNDIEFSSSVFPSWRPGRFNNLRSLRIPYEECGSGVLELPFAVYSDCLRIPVSLSYLKLFGAAYEQLVARAPPEVVIFDFHMHDLVVPPTFSKLSLPYQAVYSRQKHNGFDVLDRFIQRLQFQGYTFGQMSDLYMKVSEENAQ